MKLALSIVAVLAGMCASYAQTIPNLPPASSLSPNDLFIVDQSVPPVISLNGRQTRRATLSQLIGVPITGTPSAGNAPIATGPGAASWGPPLAVSVKAFDVKGDNATDDYPNINTAIGAVSAAGGGTLDFPCGTYLMSSALVPLSNVNLQGHGACTIIKNNGSMGGPPANNGLSIYGTLTGTPFISGTAVTYPIDPPTEGTNTVKTTTNANAGNFSAGQLLLISSGGHSSNFWNSDWITTIGSVNAGTGIITLSENLPFGGANITTVQQVLYQPQNIKISDMTILGANDGSLVVQFAKDITIENVTIQAGSGGVSGASLALIGSRNVTLRNSKGFGVVFDVFSCFDCHILNNNLVSGFLLVDGGTQDTLLSGNVVSDPTIGQNSLAKSNGISLAILTRRIRVIGNSVKNVPFAFSGLSINGTLSDDGSHIIESNAFTGSTNTGTICISSSAAVNNTITSNLCNNFQIGISLATGSTGNTVGSNTPVGVTSPYQFDGTSSVRQPFVIGPFTIAGLPACTAGFTGSRATVSNGIASPTYQQAVSATGAVTQPVFCNGSAWIYN